MKADEASISVAKVRILFIDDRAPDILRGVQEALPFAEVTAFQNPLDALEAFRFSEVQPDLILLDINFVEVWDAVSAAFPGRNPELLGIDVLTRLRVMDPDLPIIIFTAFERLEAAFGAGLKKANSFLIKREMLKEGNEALLQGAVRSILEQTRFGYDRAQQQLAERVADAYRTLETGKPGTVAYWHFEEERLVDRVRRLLEQVQLLQILDVGTGDGRYPEVIFREFPRANVAVTGLDFSGKMLAESRRRLRRAWEEKRLVLTRGIAESLPFPAKTFDLIIAGFGFLSYCDSGRVLEELLRVGTERAEYLMSIYNYDALFYSVWTERFADPEVPISGKIDRDLGVLHIGESQTLRVRPTRIDETRRLLERSGFEVLESWSFPTLYSTLGCSMSRRLNEEPVDPSRYHGFGDFSQRLYEQDLAISASLNDKGYYGLYRCGKSAGRERS